jgi:phosphoribosylformimino-5-aminoimidazole carboxamide ribotide isomerase
MIQIIPAIDLMEGKCVRLTRGDFASKSTYSDDPVETAKAFEAIGIRRLHMVDLDGARSGKLQNIPVLERVAAETSLVIDFGGGVRSNADLHDVFNAGAAIANIGSVAVKDPELFLSWLEKYGGERILLGADTRNGLIAVNGWQAESDVGVVDLLERFVRKGARNVFVTDIDRDGSLGGPSIELYEEILASVPDINLIASGGVRDLGDIASLERIGCSGVIIGKAIYEGRIALKELAEYVG